MKPNYFSKNAQNLLKIYLTLLIIIALLCTNAISVVASVGAWNSGIPADIVLGQSNFIGNTPGTSSTVMNQPNDVAVDPNTGKVFIADKYGHRVLRYSSANAAISGSAAEAVLGQADFTSNLANRGGSVAANTMYHPSCVLVDSSEHLWVADYFNFRVLRFDNASTKASGADADGVLGQIDFVHSSFGTTSSSMIYPCGMAVGASGRLWVSDEANNRVLRFDNASAKSDGADADGVLGQNDFTSAIQATTQNRTISPGGLVETNTGTLFVTDRLNNRVLRFDIAASKSNGANADAVLGQADYNSNVTNTTSARFNWPQGVAYEEATGQLFVSDKTNSRVLIFNNATSKSNGANADSVLGQSNFTTDTPNTAGISASTLNTPGLPFYDNTANVLWLADQNNHRVLRYSPVSPSAVTLSRFEVETGSRPLGLWLLSILGCGLLWLIARQGEQGR